jgi:hypothetical protein
MASISRMVIVIGRLGICFKIRVMIRREKEWRIKGGRVKE